MTKKDWHGLEAFVGLLMTFIGIFGSRLTAPPAGAPEIHFLNPYVGGLMTGIGFAMCLHGIDRYYKK